MDLIWGVKHMLQMSGLESYEPKHLNDTESTFEGLGNRLVQTMSNYTNLLKEEGIPPPALAATQPSREPHNPRTMAERARIIDLCSQISTMVMDPEMHLFTSSLQFHFCACLKTAVDLRIHDHVPKKGTIMAGSLAKAIGADEALLKRIMRILIAKSIFCEPKENHYAHTPASLVITQRGMPDLLGHRLDESFRSASRLPDALANQGYREPKMGDDFGFQLAFGTKKDYWEYIQNDPKYGARFARAMRAVTVNMLDEIPALYPFDQLKDHGGLIVDVGGGMGLVAQRILSYWCHAGLKCIVQDKSGVDASNGRDDIETQLHDFFEPQPIKGAAAYLFRQIFHDWPDQACVTILKQTIEAMDPKESRILIIDQVMTEQDPSLAAVLYDIDMMALYGGKERTLSEWKRLLSAASPRLEIANIFKSSSSMTAVLEVRLGE